MSSREPEYWTGEEDYMQQSLLQLISIAMNLRYQDDHVYDTYTMVVRLYEQYRQIFQSMSPECKFLLVKLLQQIRFITQNVLPVYCADVL